MRRPAILVALAVVALSTLPGRAQAPADTFFDSNGVRIRYVEQGRGEPVVLVHGYTVNIEANWIDTGVWQNLAADHRVIGFDLRGHGKSGKPHEPAAYGEEMVRDVTRLMDHLGLKKAHVVGYSLGAGIVAKAVTLTPDRFATATLGGHAGYRNWQPRFDESAERYAQELEAEVPFRGFLVSRTPRDEPPRTEEYIRTRSKEMEAMNDVKALAAYNRAGTRGLSTTDAEMAATTVPLLGIMGSRDNPKAIQVLKGIQPAMTVVIIEGANHFGSETSTPRRPEFTAAVREFVKAHRINP